MHKSALEASMDPESFAPGQLKNLGIKLLFKPVQQEERDLHCLPVFLFVKTSPEN